MRLVIGNKNYSSWSLRPWLLLTAFDVPFEEQWVSLQEPNLSERLKEYSKSAKVPVLQDNGISIWDSLAICEYINEVYLQGKALPVDVKQRAIARSVCAEMHSSFAALRNEMPMNIRASRVITPSAACERDIQRVVEIWNAYAREDEHGRLVLFGQFGIADCMFAPVAMRFATYLPQLSDTSSAYVDSIKTHPAMQLWIEGALKETEIVDVDEAGTDRR